MSLIDPRHLIAPLRNKTHLFTIISVIVVFGLFRYLGGGITTNAPSESKRLNSGYAKESEALDPNLEEEQELIDEEPEVEVEPARKPKTGGAAKNADTSELDDIEKAMGLK